jgi:hypothetical protein
VSNGSEQQKQEMEMNNKEVSKLKKNQTTTIMEFRKRTTMEE